MHLGLRVSISMTRIHRSIRRNHIGTSLTLRTCPILSSEESDLEQQQQLRQIDFQSKVQNTG